MTISGEQPWTSRQSLAERKSSPLDGLSYYRATAAPYPGYPPLVGEIEADVAVIGAGFTGLSAALELRKRGFSVRVLEAGPVGWGASGRNGGQICTSFSPGMMKIERQLGFQAAKNCFAMAEEAKELIRDRIARYGISCDLKWGYMLVAAKPSHMAALAEEHEEYIRYGYAGTSLIDRAALMQRLGSEVYHGALLDPGAGHFHTLNYALGLARAAARDGAVIHEHTRVREISGGVKSEVRTEGGAVRARHVILACNAYIGELAPRPAARIMPVASYAVATERLDEERARSLIRHDEAIADSNFVVDYFRLTGDRRLLLGGRCSYSGIDPADLAASIRPRMLRIFPQLADLRIDYAWGGHIAITHNRLPDAGRIGRNIYYAQGYSGQGVALAGLFGKLMAEAVAGDAGRFDVFTRLRHAPFPGGPLRRPALVLGMLYYRLRDALA